MTPTLPNTTEEAERAMLVPQGWHGKRPGPHVAPLTGAWYVAATQPRYHADGSVTFVLTPPRDKTGPWLRVLVVAAFIGLCSIPWILIYWR